MEYTILSQKDLDAFHEDQRRGALAYCARIRKKCGPCMNESCPAKVIGQNKAISGDIALEKGDKSSSKGNRPGR